MKIKVEKKSGNPLNDILDTILNLDETNFKSATETISWGMDKGLSFYYDDEKIDIPISIIFNYLDKSVLNYEEDSIQRRRIEEIIKSRNEERCYSTLCEDSEGIEDVEYSMVKKAFEILKNEELFEKFKNFEANKEIFKLPNALAKRSQNIQNYLRVMISIFGNIDKQGQLVNTNQLLDNFYIQDIENYKQKFKELYKTYEPQLKEETKKLKYRFDARKIDDSMASVLEEEPEWQLNAKMREEIIKDIPEEMSPEEKAIFIQKCVKYLHMMKDMYIENKIKEIK